MLVLENLSSICGSPLTAEIIWNFGHFGDDDERRITLAQNPQFYKELHTLPSRYRTDFKSQSTYEYDEKKKTIYVLTNNSHGVLLECLQTPMVLDNAWVTNRIIIVRGLFLSFLFLSSTYIFIDTRGNLLGESIVSESITATDLYWNCIESLERPPAARPIQNWKETILQLCQSPNTPDSYKFYALARMHMTLDMFG